MVLADNFSVRISRAFKDWKVALLRAAVFHVLVAIAVLGIGKAELMPQQFDKRGLAQFANDGQLYMQEAEELADRLSTGDIVGWFSRPGQLHVKLFSLSVLLFRPL